MSANRIFSEAMEDDDDDSRDDVAEDDGEPEAPERREITPEVIAKLKAVILGDAQAANEELEWRMKGRAHFAPIIRGITELLCRLVHDRVIEDIDLKYYEPGMYGESGDVLYPERIEFSWRTTGDDHRYSNAPDYTITLVTGTL
jgi:hypothetical protein